MDDEPINKVWDAITASAKLRFDYDSFTQHFESDISGATDDVLILAILLLATDETLKQATDSFIQECNARELKTDHLSIARILGRLQYELATEVQALKIALCLCDRKDEPEAILKAVQAALHSEILPPIEVSIREGMLELIEPYLKQCYWHRIFVEGKKIEVLIKVDEKDISDAILIRVTWSDENKEIHIPNILLPNFMRHTGVGKEMIKRLRETANVYGYTLFVVQLTQRFFRRLKKRGAIVIKDGDCVQITDATNLEHSPPLNE